jgi:carbohydrate-binding DOMON domain-containing protein
MKHQPTQTRAVADDGLERVTGAGAGGASGFAGVAPALVLGVSPANISVPSLSAQSKIFFTLVTPNASTALGVPEATITPGTPGTFIITSHQVGTPGATQTGDLSTYAWHVNP